MAKIHTLVSPFGELTVQPTSDHTLIQAPSPLAADWGLGWWHAHGSGDEAVYSRSFWRSQLSAGSRPTAAQVEMDAFTAAWGLATDLAQETSDLPAGHRSRVQVEAATSPRSISPRTADRRADGDRAPDRPGVPARDDRFSPEARR